MNFVDALQRLKGGKTLTRAAWPMPACLKLESDDFLFINFDEPGPTLTHADILADDWQLVFKEGSDG